MTHTVSLAAGWGCAPWIDRQAMRKAQKGLQLCAIILSRIDTVESSGLEVELTMECTMERCSWQMREAQKVP